MFSVFLSAIQFGLVEEETSLVKWSLLLQFQDKFFIHYNFVKFKIIWNKILQLISQISYLQKKAVLFSLKIILEEFLALTWFSMPFNTKFDKKGG